MSYENREYGMQMEMFSRRAPMDHFRVIGEDTRTGKAWLNGDFETIRHEEVFILASKNHGDFVRMRIYNDQGEEKEAIELHLLQQMN